MKPDPVPTIRAVHRPSFKRFAACAAVGLLSVTSGVCAEETFPGPLEAQFRGCGVAGWCLFSIEAPHVGAEFLPRVRPDGILRVSGDDELSVEVRDRLNALLASMIHQHKRILLHDFRALDDGTFAAGVTVNGVMLASDPILVKLLRAHTGNTR